MTAMGVSAGARLDRLPISRFHTRMLGLISAGAFLDAFDVYLAASVMTALQEEGFATMAQNAAFVSMTFVGMLIGASFAGFLGDHFGRRYSYQFNLAVFGLASFAAAFAPSMTILILCRFVMGIGLGAELVVAAGTLGEFIPPQHRGRWVGAMGLITNSGLLAATSTGYLVIPLLGWRYMFIIAGVGALIVWLMRKQMPESPRWLESVGRDVEAEAVLRRIEAEVAAEKGPLDAIVPVAVKALVPAPAKALFGPKLRGRMIAAMITVLAINVTIYGFVSWLPTFLVQNGASLTSSLGHTTLMAIGSLVGSALAVLIADRLPRRKSIMLAGMGVIGLGALYCWVSDPLSLTLVGGLLLASIYLLTTIALFIYVPELFPTRYRLRGVGVASMFGRVGSILTPYATVLLFAAYGITGVLALVVAVLVAMIVALAILGVDVTGASLDAPDEQGGDSGVSDATITRLTSPEQADKTMSAGA